ncbi:ABC transporter ATP-binding protein [Lacrimispora defluvii]|uniref:ABC transporter ATP-binding protein n=1 Tax=Lacrimispora defluvii TaxID=2719233 RepID=A0ABX1VTF5_9FIRM|nr:ABC transporter ATP-binding protein [Lacrimispora defluvii]NNJ31735.1 ABC transporter ATP-binding protein [Lacrimispora defluvii]
MKHYLSQIKEALDYLGKEKRLYLVFLLSLGFGYSGMAIAISLIPQVLIDASVSGNYEHMTGKLFLYAALFFISFVISILSQYIYRRCVLRFQAGLRRSVMEKKGRLPVSYFENRHSGEFLSQMIYDINKAEELYRSKYKEAFNPMVALITSIIPMFLLDHTLTMLLLFISLLCVLANAAFSDRVKIAGRLTAGASAQLSERSSDILSGILTIKEYQLNEVLSGKFRTANEEYAGKALDREKIGAFLEAMNSGFTVLCSIVFLVAGSVMVQSGKTTYGTLVALMNLESSIIWAALSAGKRFPELFDNIASLERIQSFLTTEEEVIHVPDRLEENRNQSFIEFRNVGFSYENNREVLKHFNMQIYQNEVAVITGRSGCGKSTIFKLLLGFYNADKGYIAIDGKSLEEYGANALRQMIAYIPQRPFLFYGTIEKNIRYGNPQASFEQIVKAAKAACAHDFIMELPGGYDYVVGDKGSKLSFGQRQRIAIARAFLKDAPIILFDEATSGLDYESERLVLQAAEQLIQNKTALIISHRESGVRLCNRKIEISSVR